MNPINKLTLSEHGADQGRIGPNRRNPRLEKYQATEKLLDELCPLSVTCDVRAIHPPHFREFCYHDCLGGLSVHTLSAEINCRMMEAAVAEPPRGRFPLHQALDKYELSAPKQAARKVVLLPGGNAMEMLDQSALQRLMQDEEWVLKPHPVTNDEDLRRLGLVYGYHRMIEPGVSGMTLVRNADAVATTSSSELFLVARYLGLPVTDLTRFDRSWLTPYFPYTRLLDGSEADKDTLDRAFTSDLCGHLRPEQPLDRRREIATAYFTRAMALRERFRMITNQRLEVYDNTIKEWA